MKRSRSRGNRSRVSRVVLLIAFLLPTMAFAWPVDVYEDLQAGTDEIRNAFDDVLISSLSNAFLELNKDEAVRAVVLAGAGKAFCAGADLNWMKRMASYGLEQNLADARALAEMLKTLDRLPKPTVARVHGPAFAGGTGLGAGHALQAGNEDQREDVAETAAENASHPPQYGSVGTSATTTGRAPCGSGGASAVSLRAPSARRPSATFSCAAGGFSRKPSR